MFTQFELRDFKNSDKNLKLLIKSNKQEIKKLLLIKDKTYYNFVRPYMDLSHKLKLFITPIYHTNSVKNTKLTQKIYGKCIPLLSNYHDKLSQNKKLYKSFLDISLSNLSQAQKKVIQNEIRDFKLNGCDLSKKVKQKLKKINLALDKLQKEFSQNILNDTNKYELMLDKKDIIGVPKSDIALAKFKIKNKTKYKFTLHQPSYISYMTYGQNRQVREKLYKAYVNRGAKNSKIIPKILKLRDKKASLLGFDNFALLSLESKMAKTPKDVIKLLQQLANKYKKPAKKELKELEQIAKKDKINQLQSYDLAYYSNIVKKHSFQVDDEKYKPYFEQNNVLNGLFKVLYEMFGLEFKKANAKTWDNKVLVYDLFDNKKLKSRIYFDLEARDGKSGGAWMDDFDTYHKNTFGKTSLASAFVVCNFAPSSKKTPSLLSHYDVVTLFHEMGHALHHILSCVDELDVSGVNGVAWDGVEFPSQFLETFAYDNKILKVFAKHYKTNKQLSDKMINKLTVAKNFQKGLATLRQVEFGLFDFKLHLSKITTNKKTQKLLDNVRKNISPLVPPKYNRFQNSFSHIFAGGYSAGYYSYKWAEVLSQKGFKRFKKTDIFDKKLLAGYKKHILQNGGSKEIDELFNDWIK